MTRSDRYEDACRIQHLEQDVERLERRVGMLSAECLRQSLLLAAAAAWAHRLMNDPGPHHLDCRKRRYSAAAGDNVYIEQRPCTCIVGELAREVSSCKSPV